VAQIIGISNETLQLMRLQQTGPTYYRLGIGKTWKVLYLRADVNEWLKRHCSPDGLLPDAPSGVDAADDKNIG
jgi:hypothetical protein